MSSFFRFFAERHKLANLFVIMVLLMGLSTWLSIKRDQWPDLDLGEMYVTTIYPGASPEDVELNVTNKLEDELPSGSQCDFWILCVTYMPREPFFHSLKGSISCPNLCPLT
jgi:multidrug efflux pump subunit AcrB